MEREQGVKNGMKCSLDSTRELLAAHVRIVSALQPAQVATDPHAMRAHLRAIARVAAPLDQCIRCPRTRHAAPASASRIISAHSVLAHVRSPDLRTSWCVRRPDLRVSRCGPKNEMDADGMRKGAEVELRNGGRKKNKGKSREYTPYPPPIHPRLPHPYPLIVQDMCPKAADSCADRHGLGSDVVVEYAAVEMAEEGEEEDSGEDSED
ncbi:hypothetical protein C8R44DRAFT_754765 [Mycena epipterygia]|nr:hypothetical protein C8R44DRAFT_754765 [Mycena epipterygia]